MSQRNAIHIPQLRVFECQESCLPLICRNGSVTSSVSVTQMFLMLNPFSPFSISYSLFPTTSHQRIFSLLFSSFLETNCLSQNLRDSNLYKNVTLVEEISSFHVYIEATGASALNPLAYFFV